MVPQQQVPGILAAQADAAGVPEISGTVPAQRMAVWGGGAGKQKAQGLVTTPEGRRDGNYPAAAQTSGEQPKGRTPQERRRLGPAQTVHLRFLANGQAQHSY